MRPHIVDTPRSASKAQLAAFLRLERKWPAHPSRTAQFRQAGKTVRSMRLREYLRIARAQS